MPEHERSRQVERNGAAGRALQGGTEGLSSGQRPDGPCGGSLGRQNDTAAQQRRGDFIKEKDKATPATGGAKNRQAADQVAGAVSRTFPLCYLFFNQSKNR